MTVSAFLVNLADEFYAAGDLVRANLCRDYATLALDLEQPQQPYVVYLPAAPPEPAAAAAPGPLPAPEKKKRAPRKKDPGGGD
jgi:hypothetical protein